MGRTFAAIGVLLAIAAAPVFAGVQACGFSEYGTGEPDGGADGSNPTPPPPPSSSSSAAPDGAPVGPPCVVPLLDLSFLEGAGTTTANAGSAATGAAGAFSVNTGFPVFSPNVPSGPMAPPASANKASVDFGAVTDNVKDRALDFPAPVAAATEGLGTFTITGWINLRSGSSGSGGDRILFTHKDGESKGIDFAQDGMALRLGIGKYNDQDSAPKSASKLTVEAGAAASNWVYFALVYDEKDPGVADDGTVTYYFGNATTLAVAEAPQKYDRGKVQAPSLHALTIGNVLPTAPQRHDSGNGSRIVRGLLDQLRFFGKALTPADVQCHQIH